jgi:hypothetical protein
MASHTHLCKLVFRMATARDDEPSLSVDDLQRICDTLYELDVRNFYAKIRAKREFPKYTNRSYMVYQQVRRTRQKQLSGLSVLNLLCVCVCCDSFTSWHSIIR